MFFMTPAHGMVVCSSLTNPTGQVTVLTPDMAAAWLELALYLGADFDPTAVGGRDAAVLAELWRVGNPETLYTHSQQYLYHLTAYFMEGWKRPGYAWLMHALSTGPRRTVLDYGCGIGSDGLWFLEQNIPVDFAEYDNPCRRYLAWRLARRYGHQAVIYDVEDAIPKHDIVWCMDVLEHIPPHGQVAFLEKLASLGDTVLVNLVDDKGADGQLHYPVDVEALTDTMASQWGCTAQDWYLQPNGSKVRFLAYGPMVAGDRTHEDHAPLVLAAGGMTHDH